MDFHCIFALIWIISIQQALPVLVYNVKPSNYNFTMNCTNSFCYELNDIPMISFESNVQLNLLAGVHKLVKQISMQNVNNFSMIGQQDTSVTVLCTPDSGQIFFSSSVKLSIANITFMNCGAHYSSSSVTALINISPNLAAVIVYYTCTAVQIVNTTFQNSHGYSIIAVGMKGVSTITNTSFYYNQSLSSTDHSVGGILFDNTHFYDHISYKLETTLILEHCTFNNSHCTNTALTVIQSSIVHILIMNSNFINTCYTGPPIRLQYNPYKSMSFLLHNVTICNNWNPSKTSSLIELNGNSFPTHNSFRKVTIVHQVEFRHCLISRNSASNIIKHFTTSALDNTNLTIDDCIFSHNEVFDTFMLMENCLTEILIKGSKYIHNQVCISWQEEDSEGCAFFISCTDVVIFAGMNEFSFNLLYSNYLWIIDSYIILEENTILNVTSNSLVEETMIKINNKTSAYKAGLCPIQYMSYRGSLSKEFTSGKVLNFSIIFHNNFYKQNFIPFILGKALKNCEWLPQSAFVELPPGIVAKRFVHFDHQIINPTDYRFAHCLCYKGNNIDCLTDGIGPIYPGQTIEIGFVILDSDYLYKPKLAPKSYNFFQDIPKHNSTCQMELVSGTLGHKVTSGKCTYYNYTITPYQQGLQECTFISYLQTTFKSLYNKYYVSLLACPPGFLFANGKCICHPNLKEITQFPTCNIVNQSVLRPGNVWIMYSNATGEIMYTLNCPIQYCSSFSFYMQLVNPDQQCISNRKGLMCGECAEGFSATFGSSRCQKCSNFWLTITAAFMLAGLLLVIVLFTFKIDIANTNITGLILYANIIGLNGFNILTNNTDNSPTSSSAIILISLLNLDLGFELCFYNGMTEYVKLWLQFAFPIYLILIISLLLFIRKHMQCVQRLTRQNGNTIMAIMILMCSNKIIEACQSLFLYNHLSYFESDKSKYLWSIYPNIPLFDTKYLLYFLFSLVLTIILIVFNLTLVFSKKFQRNHFITLDGYQGTLKEKHMYWRIVEFLLRFITTAFSVLNKQLSVLLNTIVMLLFVCCLGIASPFKNTKYTFVECTFGFNLVCIFACASYYADSKTTNYYILVDILIFLAVIEFVTQVVYCNNVQRFNKVCKCINNHIQIWQNRYKRLSFRNQQHSQAIANYE